MAHNPSVEIYLRLMDQKHQALITALDALLHSLVDNNPESKKIHADRLYKAADDIKSLVAEHDCPSWLTSLQAGISNYMNNQWNDFHLMNHNMELSKTVRNHRWDISVSAEAAVDFDSIFERYKSESRLGELFDEIIKILEDIQASGAIDSITITKALSKVIATVKKNRNGSYFSLDRAWDFLSAFLTNFFFEEMSKIPILGSALEALKKTVADTSEEMQKVHSQLGVAMTSLVEAEIIPLKAARGLLTYNSSGIAATEDVGAISVTT